jgi:hypothetical protein
MKSYVPGHSTLNMQRDAKLETCGAVVFNVDRGQER